MKMRFERSGRGQEPSRGHKFSILENVLSIRDFTSAMRLYFRSDLVGVALVGATPLHLLSQTAQPLKSPTGAFIAALRFANAVPPQTLLESTTSWNWEESRISLTFSVVHRCSLHRIRQNLYKRLIEIINFSVFLCTEQKTANDRAGTVQFLNVCQVFG